MLKEIERAKGTDKGGRTSLDGDRVLPSNPPLGGEQYHEIPTGNIMSPVLLTLTELGITKRESSEAQKLAALPEEKFEQQIADILKVPQRTISRWLNNGYITSDNLSQTISLAKNTIPSLATSITLYQAKYEDVSKTGAFTKKGNSMTELLNTNSIPAARAKVSNVGSEAKKVRWFLSTRGRV